MRNLKLKIEFALILLFFVVLPLVVQFLLKQPESIGDITETSKTVIDANFNLEVLFRIVIGIALLLQFKISGIYPKNEYKGFFHFLINVGYGLLLFGYLVLINVFCSILLYIFPENTEQQIVWSNTFGEFILFIISIVGSAFFEEVVFRMYFPEAMKIFIKKENNLENTKIIPIIICETLGILFFASGHIYLGVAGVINAVLAGIVLRFCFIKTKSIWINVIVHAIYNLILFALAFIFSNVQALTS